MGLPFRNGVLLCVEKWITHACEAAGVVTLSHPNGGGGFSLSLIDITVLHQTLMIPHHLLDRRWPALSKRSSYGHV